MLSNAQGELFYRFVAAGVAGRRRARNVAAPRRVSNILPMLPGGRADFGHQRIGVVVVVVVVSGKFRREGLHARASYHYERRTIFRMP